MSDMDAILANKQARLTAEEHLVLLEGEAKLLQKPKRFWEVILRAVSLKMSAKIEMQGEIPILTAFEPGMSEKQATVFENQEIRFGKFAGMTVGQVDPEYLAWMCEDEFGRDLRRYVKTSRFKERSGNEIPRNL